MDKIELEASIRLTKTLGNYLFDVEQKCFFADTKVVLILKKIASEEYESDSYFFDGYEIGLEEHEKERYKGSAEEATKSAIASFNAQPELFESYPIIYTDLSCEIVG